ncbi:MAG: hypothetical protein OEZ51_07150 [Nitrospinota bacterium]|nr:hypothetical protein [Nitrospinota bacterium]
MNDVKKSALWALVSIPISITLVYLNSAKVIAGDFLGFTFIPAYLALGLFGSLELEPGWWMTAVSLIAEYLGYFLFIYLSLKSFRLLTITGDQYVAKEESEIDPRFPSLWLAPFFLALIGTSLLDSLGGFGGSPGWLLGTVAFISQYLGYFLLMYVIRKLIQTRAENRTREQSGKDEPGL